MRLFSKLFGTRRRKVVSLATLGAFALTGTAVAAFLLFTGVSGTQQGTFGSGETNMAIDVHSSVQPALNPGESATVETWFENKDPDQAHSITTLNTVFSSTPSQCASHLSVVISPNITGVSIPAGQAIPRSATYSLDASTPAACASGSWTATFSGTTSP